VKQYVVHTALGNYNPIQVTKKGCTFLRLASIFFVLYNATGYGIYNAQSAGFSRRSFIV